MPAQLPRTTPYAEVEVDVGERRRDERTGLGGAADGDNNTWLRPGPLPRRVVGPADPPVSYIHSNVGSIQEVG